MGDQEEHSRVVTLSEAEIEGMRDRALAELHLSNDEAHRMAREACHPNCVLGDAVPYRLSGSWHNLQGAWFLLGEDE